MVSELLQTRRLDEHAHVHHVPTRLLHDVRDEPLVGGVPNHPAALHSISYGLLRSAFSSSIALQSIQ